MLIDEKLQLIKADELGISVSDEEVNEEIENAKIISKQKKSLMSS